VNQRLRYLLVVLLALVRAGPRLRPLHAGAGVRLRSAVLRDGGPDFITRLRLGVSALYAPEARWVAEPGDDTDTPALALEMQSARHLA